MTETCTAILRASEGPCETCQREVPSEGRSEEWLEYYTGALCVGHPYLGPRLGVCGHAVIDHRITGKGYPWCDGCYDSVAGAEHAFTTEEVADA